MVEIEKKKKKKKGNREKGNGKESKEKGEKNERTSRFSFYRRLFEGRNLSNQEAKFVYTMTATCTCQKRGV